MRMTNNTILITGGGSGIGEALAAAFHKLGNQIVISGRDSKKLDVVTTQYPGMRSLVADMTNPDSLRWLADRVKDEFPSLNVAILNAGIMRHEDIGTQSLSDVQATIATNLTGPIHLASLLLPVLRKQPQATLMTVSSGLAFVPLAPFPTYCATKAAIHSYTQSLRQQLKGTSVQVIELIPPYVQTHLTGEHQKSDPMAMPLEEFTSEVMQLLTRQPDAREIDVQRVHPLRFAAEQGQAKYDEFFERLNSMRQ